MKELCDLPKLLLKGLETGTSRTRPLRALLLHFSTDEADMTIKIAPPVRIMWRHEWLLHLDIHAVGSKEEAFKIRSHCWNAGFNSRVILLVGMSQGPQDAASWKGKMLPTSWSGVSCLHTRLGLLVMAAPLGPQWDQGPAKQQLPQMPVRLPWLPVPLKTWHLPLAPVAWLLSRAMTTQGNTGIPK